jgi:NADPH-dependent glutamate synthase beta subunit-like oxidoreductase/Pyruvate/2-oxoacid:ferredoxin oxidoreductase delta subunit
MSANGHTPLELSLKISKGASPRVDTDRCLNCGTCLRACPTGAIREAQRQICRLCPDCAEGEIMFPRNMEELTKRSCSLACPLGHYPEGYLNLVARGDWQGAWEVISAVNPLPGVLGRICGRPCEEECKRGILIDKPLPIRAAKREVAEWARREGLAKPKAYRRNIDMRVAVAGAGPAGLTAASDLATLGYRVTVFEKGPVPGGMVRQAVPSFRLPDEVWEREFAAALGDGIEVVYGAAVGVSPTLEELEKDGYKAVVLATGAPRGKLLPLPGRDFKGVYDALTFMSAVKQGRPVEVGEKVVVIGGGSVATDVARTALRKGAKEATMVCLEQECDLPALSWEVEEALREGVKLVAGYSPQRITSTWMQAEGVELACVSGICSDIYGRIIPEIDPSDTRTLQADTVIFAVGQAVDSALLERMGLDLNEAGGLATDAATGATSSDRVYAAGDLIGRQGSVVEAMASGRRAALAVDALLQESAFENGERTVEGAPLAEKIFPVRLEKLEPLEFPRIATEEALASTREVDLSPAPRELETDTRRCMRCGYIEIDHAACIGCGICRQLCPAGDVITMGSPLAADVQETGGGA